MAKHVSLPNVCRLLPVRLITSHAGALTVVYMPQDVRLLTLLSLILTKEKQKVIQEQFEKYASAVNYVIKTVMTSHLANLRQTVEAVSEEFARRYDARPEYLEDVVKTARAAIAQHRKLARTIRSMRDRTPFFKPGRLILSPPIVKIDSDGIVLFTTKNETLPIPFDKHSRNKDIQVLRALVDGKQQVGRIRLTWRKEGFLEITVRVLSDVQSPRRESA